MGAYDNTQRQVQKLVIGDLARNVSIYSLSQHRLSEVITNVGITFVLGTQGRMNVSQLTKKIAQFLEAPGISLGNDFRSPERKTVERHVKELLDRGFLEVKEREQFERIPTETISKYGLAPRGFFAVQTLLLMRNKIANIVELFKIHPELFDNEVIPQGFVKLCVLERMMTYAMNESIRRFAWDLEALPQEEVIPRYLEQFALFTSSLFEGGMKGKFPSHIASRTELKSLEVMARTDADVRGLMADSVTRFMARQQVVEAGLKAFQRVLSS